MTDEKMLEMTAQGVANMIEMIFDGEENSARVRFILAHPENCEFNEKVAPLLRVYSELRERIGKKSVGSGTFSVLKKIAENPTRDLLNGYWIGKYGRYIVCDGYRAVRLMKTIEGISECQGNPSIDKIVDDARVAAVNSVPLPSAGEVKAYIAQEVAAGVEKKDVVWWWGDDTPGVSAKFLLDMMTLFPDAKSFMYSTWRSVMYIADGHGDGILCPVNLSAEFKKRWNETYRKAA